MLRGALVVVLELVALVVLDAVVADVCSERVAGGMAGGSARRMQEDWNGASVLTVVVLGVDLVVEVVEVAGLTEVVDCSAEVMVVT